MSRVEYISLSVGIVHVMVEMLAEGRRSRRRE